jgi:hypothetical protein
VNPRHATIPLSMEPEDREFVAETQAQRRVLFLVLDHLDGRSA